VYFQNRAGFFSFTSRITEKDDRLIHVQHSDQIKRYQRRRYTRRRIRLPVFIQPYLGTSAPRKSILLELGGGGASLQNPGKSFQVEQQVELSFAPRGNEFHVLGQIVRISRGGQVIHVEFQALDEAERMRISHSVF
jgi:c-di-GMP-binding flagellar brake protein YcgR